MKRFLLKVIIIMVPFALIAAALFGIGYYSGEFRNYNKLVEEQRKNHDMLLGIAYSEETHWYKLINTNYYQPKVLALGTSRVMQFKAPYFKSDFYNAGGSVSTNYDEYVAWLKNLNKDALPEVIILGLDIWLFNDNWNKQCFDFTDYEYTVHYQEYSKINMIKSAFDDFKDGKWNLGDLNNYPGNEGFNGRIKGSGFLWDGSYYYGDVYREPEKQPDYKFKDTFERIDKGINRFEYGKDIDPETIGELELLLQFCKENNIFVIGVMPPLAPSVFEKMKKSQNYQYVEQIAPACSGLFNLYGFEFYDYTSNQKLEYDDTYFVDGFHGSEVLYGIIVHDMIECGSELSEYADYEKLQQLIDGRYSNMVFDTIYN